VISVSAMLRLIVLPGGAFHTTIAISEGRRCDAIGNVLCRCGGAIFGTCAGAIRLANDVSHVHRRERITRHLLGHDGFAELATGGPAGERCLGDTSTEGRPLEMVFIAGQLLTKGKGKCRALPGMRGPARGWWQKGTVCGATFTIRNWRDPDSARRHTF